MDDSALCTHLTDIGTLILCIVDTIPHGFIDFTIYIESQSTKLLLDLIYAEWKLTVNKLLRIGSKVIFKSPKKNMNNLVPTGLDLKRIHTAPLVLEAEWILLLKILKNEGMLLHHLPAMIVILPAIIIADTAITKAPDIRTATMAMSTIAPNTPVEGNNLRIMGCGLDLTATFFFAIFLVIAIPFVNKVDD
jgi:hypothetical protein